MDPKDKQRQEAGIAGIHTHPLIFCRLLTAQPSSLIAFSTQGDGAVGRGGFYLSLRFKVSWV